LIEFSPSKAFLYSLIYLPSVLPPIYVPHVKLVLQTM